MAAIKFNKGKIRLFKTADNTLIGIKFRNGSDTKEIYKIHKTMQSILELKYGKGIRGLNRKKQ